MDMPGQPALPEAEKREPLLGTVDRVSEMCFGLFMALTFVGAVSIASTGEDPGSAILHAALGCNLAWGLVDAVMYLVRTITDRGARLTLALAVKGAASSADGIVLLRDVLPPHLRTLIADGELAAVEKRLMADTNLPDRPRLKLADFLAAAGIFLIVVLSTFPVALPFILFDDLRMALLVSRSLTLIMLFGGGMALGRHAGYGGLKAGLAMTALGVTLTAIIIALGG
jgi:hypothetical protein